MFGKASQQQQMADFKKKRDTEVDKLRKNNRQEIFSKRRNILTTDNSNNNLNNQPSEYQKKNKILIVDDRYRVQIENFLKSNYSMEIFGELIAAITEGDILEQHRGMIGIRKILSIVDNPPIQAVIDAGLVPRMIEYIKQTNYPQLQLQATWALTNVASGTTVQCQSIIDKGGIPLFIDLLKSNNMGIVEQAIWAIGNISSDCIYYRDNIIRSGGLINLVSAIERLTDQAYIKHGCWALSNLCRGNPLPKYEYIKAAIPVLCKQIACGRLNDKEILTDCCWAISYHSDSNKNKIQIVIDSGVVPKIVKNLSEPAIGLLIPSIRILGNISTGSVQHTNVLLNLDVLTPLQKILEHHKKVVRRQCCWVLSNIAAGNRAQVDALLLRQNMLKLMLSLFQTDSNDVRRQICYFFSNMAHAGQPLQIMKLYKATNIIRYYVNLLTLEDASTVQVALECLFVVLAHGQKFKGEGKNTLVQDLHSQGAVDYLQKLQYHKSQNVYDQVSRILQTFFEIQDPLEL